MDYKYSKEVTNITCKSDPGDIRIYINEIIHLYLKRSEIISFQSWYENEYCLKIEIYTTNRDILLEYNSVEKWENILNLLDKHI